DNCKKADKRLGAFNQASSRQERKIAPASGDVKLEGPVPSESLWSGSFFGKNCCAVLCWRRHA
ncbi:hypothetical protein, partial [Pseudomonas amygdali]|uniref:hypothetical protein n=1 Tax=Pseudomonas amygdali TaxID=47877 RepID=UPI001CB90E2A